MWSLFIRKKKLSNDNGNANKNGKKAIGLGAPVR